MDPSKAAGQWCGEEFEFIDLGDPRLNRRFIRTAQMVSEQPLDPIHKSCGRSWAAAKGAYRLFDNPKLTLEKILSPHRQKTLERLRGIPQVLVIQDTSMINFNELPHIQGLGPIKGRGKVKGGPPSQGLIFHSAFALDPRSEGTPLGLLHLDIWARKQLKKGGSKSKTTLTPIEHKESFKWIEAMQQTLDQQALGVQFIHVTDREADVFEYMDFAQSNGGSFLVRCNHDRRLDLPFQKTLWEQLQAQPTAAHLEIQVANGKFKKSVQGRQAWYERQQRTAKVEIRYSRVTLAVPAQLRRKELQNLVVDAIWVKELSPPEGEFAVEWMLLTNVPVEGLEDALERIRWYKHRWHIEGFHKVLKSGCRIEDCRLETADRLIRYIGLCSIVAWRLYWLARVSRVEPEVGCDTILEEHEWKALYCKIHRTAQPPQHPPTARQAIRWLAQLGGFLGRKSDGEPGVKAIWRGWQRMTDIAEDWLIFSNLKTCG